MEPTVIRPARPEDAAALLAIYAPYVEKTAVTFEYQPPSLEEFAGRIRRTLARYPYLAAEREGRILGYAYAGPFHPRPAYCWSAEASIYVWQDARRQGIGSRLYFALEAALKAMGILNLNACIAYPEAADEHLDRNSVEFHRCLGYRWVGQFHSCGYKFGRWYDMVWMEKMLGLHSAVPEPVRPFPAVRPTLVGNVLEW